MKLRITAFGIAKDILGARHIDYELEGRRISDLKSALIDRYPAFRELASLRFAVEEEYQDDQYELKEAQQVVIIPPVSGG